MEILDPRYEGKFNLNNYLVSFIRYDIVNEYDEECLKIVNKYKNSDANEVLEDMVSEFNCALLKLVENIREDQRKSS